MDLSRCLTAKIDMQRVSIGANKTCCCAVDYGNPMVEYENIQIARIKTAQHVQHVKEYNYYECLRMTNNDLQWHLGRSCALKKLENAEKVKRGPTDQPTD